MEIRRIEENELLLAQELIPLNWHADIPALYRSHRADMSFYPVVAMEGNRLLAYGQAFLFGSTAWLGNIIVRSEYRRRGIGRTITGELIDYSFGRGVSTIHLAATEAGEPLYRKLGFQVDTMYLFYRGRWDGGVDNRIIPLTADDRRAVMELSYHVTGERRDHVLAGHLDGGYKFVARSGDMTGFYLPCFGNGMILALDDEAGGELLRFKHRGPGSVSVLSEENEEGVMMLEQMGCRRVNRSTRMYLGSYATWHPRHTYSRGTTYAG